METLSDLDLDGIIGKHGCDVLVETGTGSGRNIDLAVQSSLKQIFSIESNHALALQAAMRFAKEHRVTVIHGRSERGLKEALEEVPPAALVLFRLGMPPSGVSSPHERDLRLLAELRDLSRDVVVLGDLRLYEEGAYEAGPCPADQALSPEYRHVRFVEEILGKTHRLERSYRRTGSLCAYPLR